MCTRSPPVWRATTRASPRRARRCSAWLRPRLAASRDAFGAGARVTRRGGRERGGVDAAGGGRTWGDAAASAFAAEWRTTRRETSRPTLRDETAASWIREAAASTSGSARREANDGDGDANVTHQTRHEADTPSTSAPVVRVREESASAAGKLLRASRELALAAMLLDATRGAPGTRPAFPSEPPARLFGDPADVERAAFPPDSGFAFLEVPPISRSSSAAGDERWAEIREGVEFSGRAATERRFACRVAFEAGRERAVSLVLAVRKRENAKTEERPLGLAAAALLLEALPDANDAGNRSVVRAVAPLGACELGGPRARHGSACAWSPVLGERVEPRTGGRPVFGVSSGVEAPAQETQGRALDVAFADGRGAPRGTRWTPAPPPRARRAAPRSRPSSPSYRNRAEMRTRR